MTAQAYALRKNQLAVLGGACESGVAAVVSRRNAAPGVGPWATQLLSLRSDGVLIQWPSKAASSDLLADAPVEARFGHNGNEWVFFSTVIERQPDADGPILKLSLPLVVEHRDRRRHRRWHVEADPPIIARFTSVADGTRSFSGRVIDLSDCGVGSEIDEPHAAKLVEGDLYWIEITPPGEDASAAFVSRLAHRAMHTVNSSRVGWEFQAGDNPDAYLKNLARLERFLSRYTAHGHERASGSAAGGVSPC